MPSHQHNLSCLDSCPHPYAGSEHDRHGVKKPLSSKIVGTMRSIRAMGMPKPMPKGTRHSIALQAEGDARTAFEGATHVHPLPRGTSVAALKRHAGNLWHRYHRNEILPTPEMMFDFAVPAARYYIKTFVAAFQAEVRRAPTVSHF